MSSPDTSRTQPLASVVKAHGIHGAVRLRWRFDVCELHAWPRIATLRHRHLGERQVRLGPLRSVGGPDMLAEVPGEWTREEADSWRGAEVLVSEAVLPPAADDQVYLFSLIGRRALRPDGTSLGTVLACYDYGAGSVLGLASVDGGPEDVLLPLAVARIGVVDDEAHTVVIDIPADAIAHGA